MRSGGALAIVAVALLAPGARADGPKDRKDPLARAPAPPPAPADPLAVLREPGRSWTYEVVEGESLAALEPGASPRIRCKVEPWTAPGKLARSVVGCAVEPPQPNAPALPSWWLLFDDVGVRQIENQSSDVADRSKTRGLTFPRKLEGRWKIDERGRDGSRVQVIVHEETLPVRGTPQKVWVSEGAYWPPPGSIHGPQPARELIRFVPGIGPVLICSLPRVARGTYYQCMRLVEDAGPTAAQPPPPPQQPRSPDPGDPLADAGNPLAPPPPPPDASKPPPLDARKPPPPLPGRVTIASKVAHDPSTLKPGDVAVKIASAYLGGVRRCYLDVLAKQPRVRGDLSLVFTVNAVGKTTMITVKGFDDGVARCVAKLVNDWRFPIPQSTYAEPRNARFTIGLSFAP